MAGLVSCLTDVSRPVSGWDGAKRIRVGLCLALGAATLAVVLPVEGAQASALYPDMQAACEAGAGFTTYTESALVAGQPVQVVYCAGNSANPYSVDAGVETALASAYAEDIGGQPCSWSEGSSGETGWLVQMSGCEVAAEVSGSQAAGSSSPSFTQTNDGSSTSFLTYFGEPFSLTGTLSCTTVNGGTSITSALAPGQYTIDASSCSGLTASFTPPVAGVGGTVAYTGVSDGFVVSPASPSISTSQQPASATVGSSIADKATVSGGDDPSGTVTFVLYSNSTASGTPLFTDANVALSGGSATSTGYTATATGTDYWVATYNGDTNNNSVSSGTAAEPVTIKLATTSLSAAPQVVLPGFRGVGLGVVSATLSSAGKPLSGQTITFSVAGQRLCSAQTNGDGVARCTISPSAEVVVLFYNQYTAKFASTGGYAASTASTPATETR
ncbi:MAG: hypothetical protein ABR947_00735 [Solirubrobacteraceae bacterium]